MTYVRRAIPGFGNPDTAQMLTKLVVAGCLLLLVAEALQAVEWRFRPRVTLRETFSDNINISATNPEQDFVTDISPGFTLRGRSRRFSLNVFYNLQYLHYARGTSSDRIRNQFQLVNNTELAEDLFFVDFRSTVRQTNITNRANTANSTISVTDNETTEGTVTVSPYLKHRFGSFMDGEARYTYDNVDFTTGNTGSQSHGVLVDFRSGDQFQTLTWNTYYRWRREIPESGQDNTFQRVQLNGRYHFNRKYALLFGTGYEDNDFVTSGTDSTSAVTWLAGLRLTPNPRTRIEGGAEDRSFGVAPFLNASYRSRRTALSFRYAEVLTTTNQTRITRTFIPLLDPFGDPILDPDTGEAIQVPIDTPSITNQVVVNRTFEGTIAVRGRRTDVGVTLYDQRRDFEISPDEEVYGVRVFVNRRLSRRLSIRLSGRAQRSEFDGSTPDRTQWQVGLGLNRQFSRDFSARLDVQHITQNSDAPSQSYDENRVTLGLTKYF